MPSDDRVVQTDRQATLYYRISEDTVKMIRWQRAVHEISNSLVSGLPVCLACVRMTLGLVLGFFYAIRWSDDPETKWVAADYGCSPLRVNEYYGCNVYRFVIWGVFLLMGLAEILLASQTEHERQHLKQLMIFPALWFFVLPVPMTVVEERFVTEGFGDPFRAITVIYLYKWSSGPELTLETLIGLMIVSHDSLFYGYAPGILSVALYFPPAEARLKLPGPDFIPILVSVVRVALHRADTTCLLVSATALEAVFLSSLIFVAGLFELGLMYFAWRREQVVEVVVGEVVEKGVAKERSEEAGANRFKLL